MATLCPTSSPGMNTIPKALDLLVEGLERPPVGIGQRVVTGILEVLVELNAEVSCLFQLIRPRQRVLARRNIGFGIGVASKEEQRPPTEREVVVAEQERRGKRTDGRIFADHSRDHLIDRFAVGDEPGGDAPQIRLPGKGRKLDVKLLRSSWLGDDVAADGGKAPMHGGRSRVDRLQRELDYAPYGHAIPILDRDACAHGFALANQPVFRGKAVQENAPLSEEPGNPCQCLLAGTAGLGHQINVVGPEVCPARAAERAPVVNQQSGKSAAVSAVAVVGFEQGNPSRLIVADCARGRPAGKGRLEAEVGRDDGLPLCRMRSGCASTGNRRRTSPTPGVRCPVRREALRLPCSSGGKPVR